MSPRSQSFHHAEASVTAPRTDRRTNRTRRQLREALLALILEKGYDSITVEDITGRADLGRTTFYLHYRDRKTCCCRAWKPWRRNWWSRLD